MNSPPTPLQETAPEFWSMIKSLYQISIDPQGCIHQEDQERWDDLIKVALPPNAPPLQNESGHSVFMVALWVQKDRLALALLKAGANPYHESQNGLMVFQSILRESVSWKNKKFDPEWLCDFLSQAQPELEKWKEYKKSVWGNGATSWACNFLSSPSSHLEQTPQVVQDLLGFAFDDLSEKKINQLVKRCSKSASKEPIFKSPAWLKYVLSRHLRSDVVHKTSPVP